MQRFIRSTAHSLGVLDKLKFEIHHLKNTLVVFSVCEDRRTMAAHVPDNISPAPAYYPTSDDSPLHPPTALYQSLRDLEDDAFTKIVDLTIPPRSGRAWKVPAGSLFRLSTPEGPQVGDLNIWNASDPRERFWAARTRQLQGSHMIEGDRLWSNLPFMRPLAGIISDGCLIKNGPGNAKQGGRQEISDERGGITKWGGRCHDLLGTRCDPYIVGKALATIKHL